MFSLSDHPAKNKKIPRSALKSKWLYFVFTLLLSVPVGGYIYNFQEFFVSHRVENTHIPFTKKGKINYRFYSLTRHNKAVKKNFECYKYQSVQFENIVRTALILQSKKYHSIARISPCPPNRYHYDNNETEPAIKIA